MGSTRLSGNSGPTTVGMITVVAVLLFAVVGEVPAVNPAGSTPPELDDDGVDAAQTVVRLSATGPTVVEMVDAVRRQARRTPGADGDAEMTLVLSGDLARELGDERPLLAGQQRGGTAYVRVDVAWPERTVVHEVAHVMTDGDGHGEIWRAVYLGAMAELYGSDAAHRETRRVAWVHDRCYLTDSCPDRPDGSPPL
jgi:hypothetical protein